MRLLVEAAIDNVCTPCFSQAAARGRSRQKTLCRGILPISEPNTGRRWDQSVQRQVMKVRAWRVNSRHPFAEVIDA